MAYDPTTGALAPLDAEATAAVMERLQRMRAPTGEFPKELAGGLMLRLLAYLRTNYGVRKLPLSESSPYQQGIAHGQERIIQDLLAREKGHEEALSFMEEE